MAVAEERMSGDAFPPIPEGRRHISPTDVAQFIRLDQCQRYLRLRLHQNNMDGRFMRQYGVIPQSIPPLLTRSGAEFEEKVEAALSGRYHKVHFVNDFSQVERNEHDNDRVVDLTRGLEAGGTLMLLQPRLEVELAGWLIRGVVDIVRLEREADGRLHILIADMKASPHPRVEHRLQVAFYCEMLEALFSEAGIAHDEIEMAILYRGVLSEDPNLSEEERAKREEQFQATERYFGFREGLLDLLSPEDRISYRRSVQDLVTGDSSAAVNVAGAEFTDVPYHLDLKCDGCMFNEFCMKWSAEHDDLSLLPHLRSDEKVALQGRGIMTMQQLASVKELAEDSRDLSVANGHEREVQSLATTWPIGPRLDELIHRARRYRRFKGDPIQSLSYVPSKGYGSLPYSDAVQNPNLVRVYIDAQHDYLNDRIYLLGSLIAASEGGEEPESRRRSIVHLTDGPPESPEQEKELLLRWVSETVRAVVELAAPDEEGQPNAPIHLIFYSSFGQKLLLQGLARHATSILGATPLYDFITQLAAFDSPVVTFLDREIRELRNYPMLCQSLQAVSAFMKFDWAPYREIFRTRMFDFWGKFDEPARDENPWYTSRARFNSQIPLEYVYAAWGQLDKPSRGRDDLASYRGATIESLSGFQARRLEAMELIAKDFPGNKQTEKRSFRLPDLSSFEEKAQTRAEALDEFVTIERHVDLADWKTKRLAPPERRVLAGQTLIVRYVEEDQDPEVVEANSENLRREELRQAWKVANPDSKMSKEERAEMGWSQGGVKFRLRLDCTDLDCDLDQVLGLTMLREDEGVVIFTRTTVDSRLPEDEQTEFTPTPKQLLYGARGSITGIEVDREEDGRAKEAWVQVEMRDQHAGNMGGFVFGSMPRPFKQGERYTLDGDPDDWYGYFCSMVTGGLSAGGQNALYDRIDRPEEARADWPEAAATGQQRFLQGLAALQKAGALPPFEDGKREYIGAHGREATLLVQGPPGTGKSYSTAFAVFARMQGAMEADRDFRVLASCKTHAATDVLLRKIAELQAELRKWRHDHPLIFAEYFDDRFIDVPLYRIQPKHGPIDGTTSLYKKDDAPPAQPLIADVLEQSRWCVAAPAVGGIYRTVKDKWKDLFGHDFCDCLVLDEASQMNLAEAVMAALPLKSTGQLIVVGDHRQMPPIVKHDWAGEPRRTFQDFRAYESLFLTLLPLEPPMIKFSESFRLHADMAEFLRKEIYYQDGIPFFSRNRQELPPKAHPDPFVEAVLRPEHALVVIVHDEAQSFLRNPFEQALMEPVLEALADHELYGLDPEHGLGVVVPHRAQRAALQTAVPALTRINPQTGAISVSAVDTVERFQGDERKVIMVGATESNREYLVAASEFLLDPRRLTVALSRAKNKMILVASETVFGLFSSDEETFHNAQLWKNLLRDTCTELVWEGGLRGREVQVWGNFHAC